MSSAFVLESRARARIHSVTNTVMGIFIVIAAEIMFFGGLISAYLVARANAPEWPPAGQPRLPVERTAINTAILMASAWTIWKAYQKASKSQMLTTILLGTAFVCLQGIEWARLIGFGLTSTSSLYGSFFYLIIGAHALHAVFGLVFLAWVMTRMANQAAVAATSLYWLFVVALWPALYWAVYWL